jgi:hypothetical protein
MLRPPLPRQFFLPHAFRLLLLPPSCNSAPCFDKPLPIGIVAKNRCPVLVLSKSAAMASTPAG